MQVTFPHQLLRQTTTPVFVGTTRDRQQSISGAEVVTPAMGGHWEVTATFALKGEAHFLAWQAFLAQMNGREGTCLLPIHTRFRPKDRDGKFTPFCDISTLQESQTFEHFGFENSDISRASVRGSAGLRATDIRINLADTTGIRPGQFISIGDRLYQVRLHWEDETSHVIRIRSGLREAISGGTRIEISKPVCRVRFASEDEGLFDHGMAVLPTVTCNFVEAL